MTQTIIVAAIVAAAVAWGIWRLVRRTETGGCASCPSAAECSRADRRPNEADAKGLPRSSEGHNHDR